MASAKLASALLAALAVAVAAVAAAAGGKRYAVGEPGGSWDLQTNYTTWASSITFRLGDQLVFKYPPAAHDVVEVTKKGYLSCSPSGAISGVRTGRDAVQLDRIGRRYFICGVPGHCAAGMKLQVRVTPPSCNGPPPPPPPGANGAPGVNGAPGGVCLDGSTPTIITTAGTTSYSSAPASSEGSVSSALIMAATTMLLALMV